MRVAYPLNPSNQSTYKTHLKNKTQQGSFQFRIDVKLPLTMLHSLTIHLCKCIAFLDLSSVTFFSLLFINTQHILFTSDKAFSYVLFHFVVDSNILSICKNVCIFILFDIVLCYCSFSSRKCEIRLVFENKFYSFKQEIYISLILLIF